MSTFNEGDYVLYRRGTATEDKGVVQHQDQDDQVWVKWDSNGRCEHTAPSNLELLGTRPNPDLNHETLSSDVLSWILEDSPAQDEIKAVCKFVKFLKGKKDHG